MLKIISYKLLIIAAFKQHRESIRSKWIDKTGEFVDMIKNQFNNENVNLRENLEDLKAVVTLNQENIQASEVKNQKHGTITIHSFIQFCNFDLLSYIFYFIYM